MLRSAYQSLSTALLAAVDIGLGSVLHQNFSAPLGLLLITVGLLVIVAALAEVCIGSHLSSLASRVSSA